MKRALLSLAVLASIAACEKSDPFATKGSGDLTAAERALLGDLPGGNTLLFGGNYVMFQKDLSRSPMGMMLASLNQQSPGLSDWADCFIAVPNVTMVTGVKFDERMATMRFVMRGIDMAAVQKCADRAKYAATLDPDGKFISLEMPSAFGDIKTGYLKLPDGALLTAQSVPLGGRAIAPIDRAMLEADAATLATGSALLADKALTEAIPSINRSKAIWFVGTGAGTPIEGKIGFMKGTMDITNGLAFDVTAQVLDKDLLDKLVKSIPEVKKQASTLGGEAAAIVKALQFDQAGDQVHMGLALTNAQTTWLVKQAAPMLARPR